MDSRRAESPLYNLDAELVFVIMNKCGWSDFGQVRGVAEQPRTKVDRQHRRPHLAHSVLARVPACPLYALAPFLTSLILPLLGIG